MAATDTLQSLDDMLQRTRTQHADELKALNDQLLAAQLELHLTQDALTKQQERTANAERITVSLITQFAIVDTALTLANKAFADAKALALTVSNGRITDETHGQDDNNEQMHYEHPPEGYIPPGNNAAPTTRAPMMPRNTGTDPDAPHG